MNTDKDFRVGDVVCDITKGTGIVDLIMDQGFWRVEVTFNGDLGILESYSEGGFIETEDTNPALYHGTWEEVFGNLPTIKPKRKVKKWLNRSRNGGYTEYERKNMPLNMQTPMIQQLPLRLR